MSVLGLRIILSSGQWRDTISFPYTKIFPLQLRKSAIFTFETKLYWSIYYEALTNNLTIYLV